MTMCRIATFAAFMLVAMLSRAGGDVAIVVPQQPTDVEMSAADELRDAAEKMTGTALPIVREGEPCGARTRFWIGATAQAGDKGFAFDEILVRPVEGGVVLTGDPKRGVLYAVVDYLERDCGVRWWTSTESDYPKLPALPVPAKARRHAPTFKYREVYYRDVLDPGFKVHLRSNFASRTSVMNAPQYDIPLEKGGSYRFPRFENRLSAYHTMFVFVPPKKHFAAHPEWFSMRDGRRVPKQLCLTNPEMEALFTSNVIEHVRRDPGASFIQVSQMDNDCPCQCAACRAVEDEEGGAPSAPLLRFVNRVAEAVEKVRPDIMIDTFAYKYTRRAPTKTRPRENVVVRLCDIECAFNRTHEEQPDSGFMKDLEDWSRIARGRLFLWTYTTDFLNYLLPHPNYHVLAPNLRLFAARGAVGVFEQGDVLCAAGEFAPLRTWVLAHLNWDVSVDERKLADEFLRGYYGADSAPHLRRYLDLLTAAAVRPESGSIGCYHKDDPWLSLDDALELEAEMSAAVRAAELAGDPWRLRVQRERLSLDNLWLIRWDEWRKEAQSRGLAWRKGEFEPFAMRWIAECAAFGVYSHKEFNTKGFSEKARLLLDRIDGRDRTRRGEISH